MKLTEEEILEKLNFYKNAIIALISDRDNYKNKCAVYENAVKESETTIENLNKTITNLQSDLDVARSDADGKTLAYNSLLAQYNTVISQPGSDEAFKQEVEKLVLDIQEVLNGGNN